MKTFADLFRKYRLKSEFSSITEFADAFASMGQVYDTSIYSHWQKGNRIPSKRIVVLDLIELFLTYGGMQTIEEANEFLESAGHGYLTFREQKKLIESKPLNGFSGKLLFD